MRRFDVACLTLLSTIGELTDTQGKVGALGLLRKSELARGRAQSQFTKSGRVKQFNERDVFGSIARGEVAEWSKASVLKTDECKKLPGFESLSHRQSAPPHFSPICMDHEGSLRIGVFLSD